MKDICFTIVENTPLNGSVYKMVLSGDTSEITKPGQFINIALPGLYLRRPISVCDKTKNSLTIIYKAVGHGTELMTTFKPEEKLTALTGLGNGYNTSLSGENPVLIGGGVGVPPLYLLARLLREQNKKVSVILGFNTKNEIFYEDEFKALGCEVFVTTVDGSYGIKGFVTAAIPDSASYFYTCGPEPMLKAVCENTKISGQLSFEERMGCGFGACVGCTKKTRSGNKRVCKDGPVFTKEDVIWES